MPGPPAYGGQPITNIRDVSSPHWRGWVKREDRCIVPATSFCEYGDTEPRKTPTRFALSDDRSLFAFAGIWTRWTGVRGPKSAPRGRRTPIVRISDDDGQCNRRTHPPKAMPSS